MTAESLRARVRAEMVDEIKASARRHLAAEGANLSLRAVARDLGVVSSALYRYFAGRDELLTALIIDAYNSLGDAADAADAAVERADLTGRYYAVAHALRSWAQTNPAEYALLYGSPVPGYSAPMDTVEPAGRPVQLMFDLLRDAVECGVLTADPDETLPPTLHADLARLVQAIGAPGVPEPVVARAIGVWAQLFGVISFELFGRLQNGITDYDAFFDYQIRLQARTIGFES